MPNLRQSIIEEYWVKKDPRLARILTWMESMEDWMLDENEDVASSIYALANTLERVPRRDVVDNANDLAVAMAYMSSPRAMRLLTWFDEHFPQGVSVEITEKALENKDDECAKLLLDRFDTLHRLHLLTKLFSPARTRAIIELLEEQPVEP